MDASAFEKVHAQGLSEVFWIAWLNFPGISQGQTVIGPEGMAGVLSGED